MNVLGCLLDRKQTYIAIMHQGVARSWKISIQIMWSSMLASHATLHIQGTPEHDVCGMLLIGDILKQSRLPILYSAIYPLSGQRIILVILRNNMVPCNIGFYNVEQRLLSAYTCSTECWGVATILHVFVVT